MERLIFRRNAKEGTVNLWLFNWSLIIDLWIKGFAITVFNLLYKLNITAINLRNFSEYLQSFHAVSHFRVAFRKEKACKIIFFILPIWSTRPLKLMSSRSERGLCLIGEAWQSEQLNFTFFFKKQVKTGCNVCFLVVPCLSCLLVLHYM